MMSSQTGMMIAQMVLLLFFTLFTGVVIWAVRMPQSEVDLLGRMPLGFDDAPGAHDAGPDARTQERLAGGERRG